jgi:hypothetical protein
MKACARNKTRERIGLRFSDQTLAYGKVDKDHLWGNDRVLVFSQYRLLRLFPHRYRVRQKYKDWSPSNASPDGAPTEI